MDRPSLSLLARSAPASAPQFTSLQISVDALSSSFFEHATDWRSLTAMTAGGAAYRLGRVGLLGLSGGGISRVASLATGLGAEITAFELTHRTLHSGIDGNPNRWRWSGSGGLGQGLFQSSITFGSLRGVGRLTSSQNLLVQHVFQDAAMVFGHNVSGALGATSRPTTSLAEQFLHAEATLWQMQAGMSLAHGIVPRLGALERGLDLSFPSFERRGERYGDTSGGNFTAVAVASSSGRAPSAVESPFGPSVLWMSGRPKGKDGEGTLPTKAGNPGSGERPRVENPERISETETFGVDETFRAIAETSAEGYVTINERGLILYANPALHGFLGYEKSELRGRPLTVLIPPSFRKAHEAGLRRYLQSGTPSFDHRKGLAVPALHKDGSWVQVHISFQEQTGGKDRIFTGMLRRNAAAGETEVPRLARSSPVEGGPEKTPLPPNPRTASGGPFARTSEKSASGSTPSPARSTSPSETSYIGLKVERPSESTVASREDLSRLQSELSSATTDFKGKVDAEGGIELRIPSRLRREFLEQNTDEIVKLFYNRVWAHVMRPGRKVSLVFEMRGEAFRIELEKAEEGGFRVMGTPGVR